MTLNTAAAYGMYSRDAELRQAVHTLSQSGFDKENICMMVSPRHPIATLVREANILNAEKKRGAVAEGVIGWLFEFGAVLIPTVGFFIRSQPFLHALMSNCNSRALTKLGFTDPEADRFEDRLRQVGVLLYVSCAETANAEWAVEVLRRTGAKDPALLEQEKFMEAAV
jgi:Heat induced stress protein YflT